MSMKLYFAGVCVYLYRYINCSMHFYCDTNKLCEVNVQFISFVKCFVIAKRFNIFLRLLKTSSSEPPD